MSSEVLDQQQTEAAQILQRARSRARALGLKYAGVVDPTAAWQVVQAGAATLVDVRTPEELVFVGAVPGTVNIPWALGTQMLPNPDFLMELSKTFSPDQTLLLLCRSGQRSAAAAAAAKAAGYANVFNISEGFEGNIDADKHRGGQGGWRFRGLPWVQS